MLVFLVFGFFPPSFCFRPNFFSIGNTHDMRASMLVLLLSFFLRFFFFSFFFFPSLLRLKFLIRKRAWHLFLCFFCSFFF